MTTNTDVLVMGVGGGGCNIVARIAEDCPAGLSLVAVHSDLQILEQCPVDTTMQIGRALTGGLSTGGDPGMGRRAARAATERISASLVGVKLLMLITGLGGGTGSGATPIIADIARKAGVLTLCFATLPFEYEGQQRSEIAAGGLEGLRGVTDAIITLPNQRIVDLLDEDTSIDRAFAAVDEMMITSIKSLWHLLTLPGFINMDFTDLRKIVEQGDGTCVLVCAHASGKGRASAAVRNILESPLLEDRLIIKEAPAILVGIMGGADLTMLEVQEIMRRISASADAGVSISMGATVDEQLSDCIELTVLLASPDKKIESSKLREVSAQDDSLENHKLASDDFQEKADSRMLNRLFMPVKIWIFRPSCAAESSYPEPTETESQHILKTGIEVGYGLRIFLLF